MTLRKEFMPLLISPDGLHADAAACAKAWDRETSSDARLSEMINLSSEWLERCARSRSGVNRRIPSSFGLAHIASRWHGRDGHGPQILSGCLLMAAHRLGFEMERQAPKFIRKIGRNDANAFLDIASWPADSNHRPGGVERKETRA
jgi:hypothetical protein